jgi:acetylornithine aminotransferase
MCIRDRLRGVGLMVGIDLNYPIKSTRVDLLRKNYIFTGVSGTYTLRLLPPMTLKESHIGQFMSGLEEALDSG